MAPTPCSMAGLRGVQWPAETLVALYKRPRHCGALRECFAGMPAIGIPAKQSCAAASLSGRSAVARQILAPPGLQERNRLVVLVHGDLRLLDWTRAVVFLLVPAAASPPGQTGDSARGGRTPGGPRASAPGDAHSCGAPAERSRGPSSARPSGPSCGARSSGAPSRAIGARSGGARRASGQPASRSAAGACAAAGRPVGSADRSGFADRRRRRWGPDRGGRAPHDSRPASRTRRSSGAGGRGRAL